MRLRSLHIKGFKSFANDTLLNFDENVIGVVGPNGAGKSNIVDAIRWVLGEQKSRELRLETMSDVIFNGTKTRKESGLAQVTLTFDNTKNILPTDFQSVSVSRLLYRTGESEYRLNNVPCRLKDVRSLFIDTGIGSNSYAIIALGMVDDILNDKDNARRKMFEQASGISKYKSRKRETLNKLKITTSDLDRIEDLLFEIEGNLKSLEKQAKRTHRFFVLKEKYKELSTGYSRLKVSVLKGDYKVLEKNIAEEESQYRALSTDLKQQEADLESLKAKNIQKEQNLSNSQNSYNHLVNEIRKTENLKSLTIQKLEFKNQEISNLNNQQSGLKARINEITNAISLLKDQLNEERKSLVIKEEDLSSKRSAYHSQKESSNVLRKKRDIFTKAKDDLQKEQYQLEKELAVTENGINSAKKELEIRVNRQTELRIANRELERSYKELNRQIATLESSLSNVQATVIDKKNQAALIKTHIQQTKDELAKINRKKDALKNEYDLLKSMIDSYEGFPASIKYLSTKWNRKAPLLTDIIEVEEEYKAAIEQYLESYLNYYIVPSIKEASTAIQLLYDKQKGKAHFFLLDELESPTENPLKYQGFIPAIEVIKVDDVYKALLEKLLHGVYLYRGNLQELVKDNAPLPKIVLHSAGVYMKEPISVSGGSIGLFEGKKIGRKKNLEKTNKKIQALSEEMSQLEFQLKESMAVLDGLHTTEEEKSAKLIENELKEVQNKWIRAKVQVDNFYKSQSETDEHIRSLKEKVDKGKQYALEIDGRLKTVTEKWNSLSMDDVVSDDKLYALEQELNKARDIFNESNIGFIRQQNAVENLEKDLENKAFQLSEQENILYKNSQSIIKNEDETQQLSREINQLESELSIAYEEREEKKKGLNEVEKTYYQARTLISDSEDSIRSINRKLNVLQVEINRLKDQFNNVKFKMSAIAERLRIEFDIDLNEIINSEEDLLDTPVDELEGQLEKMRNRIQNFGEINPLAVTAYDEMKLRYDDIQQQREDIIKAKESLLLTIKEIEAKATKKFMEAFDQVRENFQAVFRSLFTEDDTCNLILIDNDDPLESDIEIIAKPKGKKPKSLSQLSGGEKTLTATALLFALYLLKPAPFCIFDEVDAPLDDANIQKFNRIVKNFSGDSQFIIVTHNKATMAAVDVLYGVYMQEQGVSAVTPVDFREYDYNPILEVVDN